MATFRKTGKEVVMVVDRSGSIGHTSSMLHLSTTMESFASISYRPIVAITSTPLKASGG